MVKRQMELSLTATAQVRLPAKPATAQWWFEKMRQVVNQACDAAAPQPEKPSWLASAPPRRQPLGLSRKMVFACKA